MSQCIKSLRLQTLQNLIFVLFGGLLLSSCAWFQGQREHSPPPHSNALYVVQQSYSAFPEAIPSHMAVEFHHVWTGSKPSVYLQSLEFYVPTKVVTATKFTQQTYSRGKQLFQHLHNPNPECLNLEIADQNSFFHGYEGPLRRVRLESICG